MAERRVLGVAPAKLLAVSFIDDTGTPGGMPVLQIGDQFSVFGSGQMVAEPAPDWLVDGLRAALAKSSKEDGETRV